MKKSENTLLYEKQLARIERILKRTDHADLTLQKPARITKSYLAKLEKIKPKNIESAISSADFNFKSKSFSGLVDHTRTNQAKAKATATATAKASAKSQSPTPSLRKGLSTSKTKTLSSASDRYKAVKKASENPTPKTSAPSLFSGGRSQVVIDETISDYITETEGTPSSVNQTPSKIILDDSYGDISGDIVDTDTGEVIGSTKDIYYNGNADFTANDVARERWEGYSDVAMEGSEVSRLIEKYIKGFGADCVFANMAHFGKEFWEALDVVARYESQGQWGSESDEGFAWVNYGDYSENVEFIIGYMADKFDPWLGSDNDD